MPCGGDTGKGGKALGSPTFPPRPNHSPIDTLRNEDFHLRMAEQKSGGKTEENEEGACMQQQQLITLHNINTGYHLLSTDYIPSMGLNMHYLFQSSQQPYDTNNFITRISRAGNRGAGMLGNLSKGHMVSKWRS